MKRYLFISTAFIYSLVLNSQSLTWTVPQQWGVGSTISNFVKRDPFNNLYVGGGYGGTMSSGCGGMFVSKYDVNGFVQWTDTMNYGNLHCGLASDSTGNIYNLIYHNPNFHLIRYASNGAKTLNVTPITGSIEAKDIQVGKDGFLYMIGKVSYTAYFGVDTLKYGGFICKMNTLGQIIWVKHFKIFNFPSDDVFPFKMLLVNGKIYCLVFVNGNAVVNSTYLSGGFSSYLMAFDTTGAVTSSILLPAVTEDFATDTNNNLFLKGEFSGSVTFGSNTVYQTTSAGSYFVSAFDGFNWLWARELPSIGRGAITTDKLNNIYCLGTSADSNGYSTYKIRKINNAGNLQWNYQSSSYGGSYYFAANDIETDSCNNIYISGTNVNGFLSKFSIGITSIGEKKNEEPLVKIYPNPSDGSFIVDLNDYDNEVKIDVFDSKGQKVEHFSLEKHSSEYKIDLSKNSKGVYFIEITDRNKKAVKKIIFN